MNIYIYFFFTCNWLFDGGTETEGDVNGSSSMSGDIGEKKMI